ncbi:DUF3078 domain-containing protein [Croceiramulus getboli]|nr:DUF3078 domain-containing protein [Flavobacteriaceae bacterium YJPT1-3]
MSRFVYFVFLFGLSQVSFAQSDSTQAAVDSIATPPVEVIIDSVAKPQNAIKKDTSYWTILNRTGLNISEVAFVNWNAGGSNSISGLGELILKRNYKKKNLRWNNKLESRFGINKQEDQELRKTDDLLEITSSFGYHRDSTSRWYYTARASLRTQFANGYRYPNTEVPISRFMAPGYLFFGLGGEYGRDIENLSIYLSPLTYKATFVLDQRLANLGSFGVTPAVRDEEGNILTPGENVRSELGILIQSTYSQKVAENIDFTNAISLYTDYLNDFGNIDIDWEINFNFKVNSFVLAKLGSHIRYDNDVKFSEENEMGEEEVLGARTQWKQQLGIGVIVNF